MIVAAVSMGCTVDGPGVIQNYDTVPFYLLMRVAFIQTYPIYHDFLSTESWLERMNRDRWMPGIVSRLGHEVELWAGATEAGSYQSELDGFGSYPIRVFETTSTGKRTKHHFSDGLIEYARIFEPDVCILKGVDGGIGDTFLKRYLLPERKTFVFVIGGKYYSRYVPDAHVVFYETEAQRERLVSGQMWRFRRAVATESLIRLEKSIDTDVFRPIPDAENRWDVISVGRLISNYKNYQALGVLSDALRVAVIGGGPAEDELKKKYPKVDWLGAVPNDSLAFLLSQATVFMHAGLRDYYPRVLAEAAACGLPCVAFAGAIKEDVLPVERGVRLDTRDFVRPVTELCRDSGRLEWMRRNNREFAERSLGKFSSEGVLVEMLDRVEP